MVRVTHSSTTGSAANPAVLVDGPKWDADHIVTGIREQLTANRTYYARADATGSGNGLSDTSSGAFRFPQDAVTFVLRNLDLNGFTVTINLTGAFTSGILAAGVFVGSGNSTVAGSGSVIIASASGASITTTDSDAIAAAQGAVLTVAGTSLTLSTTGTKGNCISAHNGGTIIMGAGITFSSSVGGHIQAGWVATPAGLLPGSGTVYITASYAISGGGIFHWHVPIGGSVIDVVPGITVTITGTPAFSGFFAGVTKGIIVSTAPGVTFSGSATGPKYLIHNGGIITGIPNLPGSVAGMVAGLGTVATQVSEADTYTGIGIILGLVNPAPGTPPAGQTGAWFDSTNLRFHDIDSTGKVGTTVVGDAGAANNFLTAIDPNTGAISKAQPTLSNLGGAGTGVLTALAVNIGSAGAPVLFNGALGSPSSVGTMPAFTLGGTVSGGGKNINNVIIGAVTPLAGSFTTLATTSTINGVTLDNTALSTYTSTFGATTGTATVVAKQKTLGKVVYVNFDVTYTSAITGQPTVTLPTNSLNAGVMPAVGINTGTPAIGDFNGSSNVVNIIGLPLTNGTRVILTGWYESV